MDLFQDLHRRPSYEQGEGGRVKLHCCQFGSQQRLTQMAADATVLNEEHAPKPATLNMLLHSKVHTAGYSAPAPHEQLTPFSLDRATEDRADNLDSPGYSFGFLPLGILLSEPSVRRRCMPTIGTHPTHSHPKHSSAPPRPRDQNRSGKMPAAVRHGYIC